MRVLLLVWDEEQRRLGLLCRRSGVNQAGESGMGLSLVLLEPAFRLGKSGHSERGAGWMMMTTHTLTEGSVCVAQLETRLTFFPTHNTLEQFQGREGGKGARASRPARYSLLFSDT